ncbi:hypothetical protein POW79_00005, partial [Enterobacter quasiroggenkampii]|uniref:hypothetical protein n=1 Tax=Enterobacter quasiroggenkampii TaxID=2497436 RepID=UPI002FF47A7A
IYNYLIYRVICYFDETIIKYELQVGSKSRNEQWSGLRKQVSCHALRKNVLQPLRLNTPGRPVDSLRLAVQPFRKTPVIKNISWPE